MDTIDDGVTLQNDVAECERALAEAIKRAREVDYRAGSPQMQALEVAERDFQRAKALGAQPKAGYGPADGSEGQPPR